MASRDSNRQGTSPNDRDQISGDKQKDSRQQQSRDEKQQKNKDSKDSKDSKDFKDTSDFNASAFKVDTPDMPPIPKETPNRKDAGSRGSNTSDRSNRSDRDGSQRGSSDESKKRDGRSGREQSSGSSSSKKDNVPQNDGPSDDHNDQPQPGPIPDMQQPPKDGQPQPSGAPDSIKKPDGSKPDGSKPGMPFINAAVRKPGMGGMNCQDQSGECGQGQWGQKDIFGNTTNPQSQDCTDPQQCTTNNGPCIEANCAKQNCGDITHRHEQPGTCSTNAQGGDEQCGQGQCDGAEDGGFGARKRCTESRNRRDECDCNRSCRDRDDDWCTNPCCEINRRRRECECRRRGCYDGAAENESRGPPRDRRDQLTPEERRAADEQWEEGRRRWEEGRYDSERRDQERRDQERRDQERRDREQGSGQREYGPVPEEELEYLRGNRT
ncbi:uncharacterized protein E0L32_008578 [Thyridium curvatum]|uniref:Uncharacterized protein n=1 Tax=Thyridium curvatum TaxID=1093900 RepID=A0A507B0N0_9PEZI|nr:uncharacterized protein E0L32_008578 [Thyridium curvatum]TPX10528.1 hypothetical protein E0L32_008578 [Thyridium curvatum]